MLSHHFFCIFSLLLSSPAAFSDDLQHILNLKSALQNPSAVVFHTWNPITNKLCNFSGITCHSDGSVQDIELSDQYLSGRVPFDSICKLKSLQKLSLGLNFLVGPVTKDLKKCVNLKYLDLGNNFFDGTVPDLSPLNRLTTLHLNNSGFTGSFPWNSLSNMSGLAVLSVGDNMFDKTPFPEVVVSLKELNWLYMSNCSIGGTIPPEIGNLTKLEDLELADNYLEGNIPVEICKLKRLRMLELYGNYFTGKLPIGLGNLSYLEFFDVSDNQLEGDLSELRKLTNLVALQLFSNGFTGEIPPEFGNFRRLVNLSIYENQLTGELPQKLGYWSEFNFLDASENFLTGPIPPNMCRKGKMKQLLILQNKFTGGIPATYAKCKSMNRLRVSNNSLSGVIPSGIWGLPKVGMIDVALNEFEGSISEEIGKAASLEALRVNDNRMSGHIPKSIRNASKLVEINLSNNQLSGGLPTTMWHMNKLSILHLQNNKISDSIPQTISSCVALSDVNMANNSISGEIPFSIGSLPALYSLNLTGNQLTGPIPSTLSSLKLSLLDLSYNHLSGQIPDSLSSNAHIGSFAGNEGLCSQKIIGFRRCSSETGIPESQKRGLAILSTVIILGFVLLSFTCRSYIRNKRVQRDHNVSDSWNVESFHVLTFTKDEILNSIKQENHIGKGGSGNVYKVSLSNGIDLAVKQILNSNPEESSGNQQSGSRFDTEVQTLSTIRHVNVVKLYCSIRSENFNLLVYEYMPNGSLWDRLHMSQKMALNWESRYEIAIGAAKGLEYLHHSCNLPIIHRDVKSSNILLDEFLKPRISDFGLAKIFKDADHSSSKDCTQIIAGTHGYIAPEYGYTCNVNEKSDVYSFGVVLMELVTGKKPIDPEYEENKDIVEWVAAKVKSRKSALSIIDLTIESYFKEDALKVLRIAIDCTANSPSSRPTMKSVVQVLEMSRSCRMLSLVIGQESK